MHVRIQAARQDVEAPRVDLVARARQFRLDGRDHAVADADVPLVAADDQIEHANLVAASMASATSSRLTDSSGWWLMPPAQRTKSIATSV